MVQETKKLENLNHAGIEFWSEKVMECLELRGMFYEILENKNVETSCDGGLACEVSEGRKDSISIN